MTMSNTEKAVKDSRRNTRRKFSTEEKVRTVLGGLRGENSIADLCRREGINLECSGFIRPLHWTLVGLGNMPAETGPFC